MILYNYFSEKENEISFYQEDIVLIIKEVEEWMEIEKNGHTGMIPKQYITELEENIEENIFNDFENVEENLLEKINIQDYYENDFKEYEKLEFGDIIYEKELIKYATDYQLIKAITSNDCLNDINLIYTFLLTYR
jgi:hypothetical protein